jgi:hypothetical protein
MGRSRYIWLFGVLFWGLGTGILWPVLMAAMQGWERFPTLLVYGLVAFPIGGYFVGVITWRMAEAQYTRATQDETNDA